MSGSSISRAIPATARYAPTVAFDRLSAPMSQLIAATTEGRNPHVQFTFREIRLPRGYVAHPPHTDLFEIRPSVTIEFRGTPQGNLLVHMFHDGTIKTREQMYAEGHARAQEDACLTAEERTFPALAQTAARKQAFNQMLQRVRSLRDDATRSIVSREVEKSNAVLEYRSFLEMQAQARRAAAAQAAQRRPR